MCQTAIALLVEKRKARPGSIRRREQSVRTNHRHRSGVDTDRVEAGIKLGPLAGYVGFMLRRIQTAVFSDFIASLGELELRPAQYSLLEVIDANPGLRQSDAAAALGIQKANFVALVHELERRALVQRRRSKSDRRCYSLHLQPRGRRLLEAARGRHDAQESRLGELLGMQDRERLLKLLNRLAEMS
jgi:DNA-binding MarR family transcriptional regulator